MLFARARFNGHTECIHKGTKFIEFEPYELLIVRLNECTSKRSSGMLRHCVQ
jgi:hypothetical protein